MSFVRLGVASSSAIVAVALVSSIAACSNDTAPDAGTERMLASTRLGPTGEVSEPPAANVESGSTSGSDGATFEERPDDRADAGSVSDGGDAEPPVPPASLRGTNLVGMEGGYGFDRTSGPVPDEDYPVHSNRIIDYLAAKKVNVIRFLFSWERMQSTLGGPVPASSSGNYKAYYDDYERIVDYATDRGMTVVIEPWQASSSGGAGGARWRGDLVGGGTVTSAHFADFWAKMAAHFANNPRVAIGLVNEPNGMSTMSWFSIAQEAVSAIRDAGFHGDIYVPGNGWTGAASWTDSGYDTGSPKRSNAYGWLNARGPGLPLLDPLGKLVVEVHGYADADASGSSSQVVSSTTSRTRLKGVTDWARENGLKVWIGEIGMYANASNATSNWNDFVSYLDASADTLVGFAWWGCGKPGWWDDVAANGGGHFSITPTNDYASDTVNMKMIAGAFGH